MNIQEKINWIETTASMISDLSRQQLVLMALEIDAQQYDEIQQLQGKGSKSKCLAQLPKNSLYYKCLDCGQQYTHVYCQACYQSEKHINHVVIYSYATGNGFCDCGDLSYVKKESCCDKHQAENFPIQNQNQILGCKIYFLLYLEEITFKYRIFIQVAFSLLYSKIEQIVQYQKDFLDDVKYAQEILCDDEFTQEFYTQLPKLLKYQTIQKEIQNLYSLIAEILTAVTVDNITLSVMTSKFLLEEIDEEVQSVIKLYHFHCDDTFQLTKIMTLSQPCNCTILELLVRFNSFLSNVINSKQQKTMHDIFIQLQGEEKFKSYICQQIIKYFNHLFLPISQYEFKTIGNRKFKMTINQFSYSEDSLVINLFTAIEKHQYVKRILFENCIQEAAIFQYLYLFSGHLAINMLYLGHEAKSYKFYQFFNVLPDLMIQMPLCHLKSYQFVYAFSNEIEKLFGFEAIEELIGCNNEKFRSILITPNSQEFNYLQNNSIFIQAITRLYPCTITKVKTFNLIEPKEEKQFQYSQCIQIKVLQIFRDLLGRLIQVAKKYNHYNQIFYQNIFRLLLNYFLNHLVNDFQLYEKKSINNLLSNQILSDRNFITILSIYLQNFNKSKEAYDDLLTLSGLNKFEFKQVMFFLLKRTLLNYLILNSIENTQYYKGQIKIYFHHSKLREVSLEQVDISYIQMYAFIFQEEGINDIIEQHQEIAACLDISINSITLICRICLSDYDYIQCLGNIYGNDENEQTQKGQAKLFQTIFYSQAFYSSQDLIELLRQFSYDSSFDIQKIILSSCELNMDNDQLQLKKSLLPALYEPVFGQQVASLKEKIDDKLKTQNDKFTELFGSSLAQELKQFNNSKSTMTYKRLAILEYINKDSKQIYLQNLIHKIQAFKEKNDWRNLALELEKQGCYINLLFQSNKFFEKNNCISDGLKIISQITLYFSTSTDANIPETIVSVFHSFVNLLDEQSSQLPQQLQGDIGKSEKFQNKKQQYQGRFKKMSESYNNLIPIQQSKQTETTCSLCYINFNQDEIQYKVALLQFTNSHVYNIQVHTQVNQLIDIFSIHASCCGHLFHEKCLKLNKRKKYTFFESSFLKCPQCFMPFNFPFTNPGKLTNLKGKEFLGDLEFFFSTIPKLKVEDYYSKFCDQNGMNVPALLTELLSSILCNLLLQLLGDITQFYEKKQYLLLQDILILLRLVYQENQNNIFDQLPLDIQQVLFQLLKIIQHYLISQYSEIEFKQQIISLLGQSQNSEAISELIAGRDLKLEVDVHQLPYNMNLFKQALKDKYLAYFQDNFRQFLVKYNLSPCGKKRCRFLPIVKIQDQEQEQYICLICLKKMCSQHCGKKSKATFGNLSRHAMKRHMSKTIYLKISNTQIIIMMAPKFVYSNLTLFQNLIGEQPEIVYQETSIFESFKINQKAVDLIVDVVSGEKYLTKMFANTQKIYKSKL